MTKVPLKSQAAPGAFGLPTNVAEPVSETDPLPLPGDLVLILPPASTTKAREPPGGFGQVDVPT